jgi:hypothetical protein
MRQIAELRTYNPEQLLSLLTDCAYSLGFAYEETQYESLKQTSFEALRACDYLRCVLAQQNSQYQLH